MLELYQSCIGILYEAEDADKRGEANGGWPADAWDWIMKHICEVTASTDDYGFDSDDQVGFVTVVRVDPLLTCVACNAGVQQCPPPGVL